MKFKYLRDPLFLFCVGLYFTNRLLLKPQMSNNFLRCHLNDLICIPFWVPIMLLLMRIFRLRRDDGPPESHEIVVPLVLWSAIFELWLPRTSFFAGLAVADYLDILWYAIGAVAAAFFWRGYYGRGKQTAVGDPPTRQPAGGRGEVRE